MATVDIDMILPIDEIAEPVIVTFSVDEIRTMVEQQECMCLPDGLNDDLLQFVKEYKAGAYL